MTMHAVLAARSYFSIGESILSPDEIVTAAKAAGATAVALTDTMSVTGMVEFSLKAKASEIKPIIGVRLRLMAQADLAWRKTRDDKRGPQQFFLTAYVLSEAGMKAIFRLLSLANSEERFYFTSRLGLDDLFDELKGLGADDLVLASGDAHSAIGCELGRAALQRASAVLGHQNVVVTLSPLNTPYWDAMNVEAIKFAEANLLSTIVTAPALYGAGDADAAEVMMAVSKNEKMTAGWHNSNHLRDLHPRAVTDLASDAIAASKRLVTQRGLAAAGKAFKEGLLTTQRLVDRVAYVWSKQPVSLPIMATDANGDPSEEAEWPAVVAASKAGWSTRFSQPVFGHQPTPEELKEIYVPRLRYELQVLKDLKFAGYFLLVQDVVQFAKGAGILVGPGRGSVGGSLVAYLMGITDCDPIRFGLLFERFINPERIDLPDADLDFMSARRHEVIDYLVQKYGQKRVSGVSNFSKLGAASAIRKIGSAFDRSEGEIACSKFVPKEHGVPVKLAKAADLVPEIERFKQTYPGIWKVAETLEGVVNVMGRHAAGIVVGGVDIEDRGVVERRKDGATVCWDKRLVEDQGLVKMDILGLSTLDLIALTLDYIRERHSKRVDLLRIPLDDENVLKLFANGKTTGVFQFESPGMRRLLQDLGADGTLTFDDVTAATALYRPGPMDSGMMASFVARKQGTEAIDYDHPGMEETTKDTYGVMVYQEQVMMASRVIAGYTLPKADKLRKIMGKKLPEEMAKERDVFVAGCVKTVGMTEEYAGELFDKIEKFAGYGFNKSHSVEYTLISYQSAWLKVNYPVEFFAAALSLMDEAKLPALLKDAASQGVELMMPDINISSSRFEIVTDTAIVIPFDRVKGVAKTATAAILEGRKACGQFTSREHFEKVLSDLKIKGKCNVRVCDSLDKVGAFARIEPTQHPAKHPTRIKDQRELIPGLITDVVPINRDMLTDKDTKFELQKLIAEYRTATEKDGVAVGPGFGKHAKFMVIFDAPSNSEERKSRMALGDGAIWDSTLRALHEAGLGTNDVYWTALIKRPKEGKQVSAAEIETYKPYLAREIELLKPPLIVALGSQAVRQFMPELKGKASEVAGKVIYNAAWDCNILLGFSPGEIYYDESKQELLNDLFEQAASLTT